MKQLYHTLALLHEKYPNTDKSLDELEAMLLASYPNMKQAELEAILSLTEQLRSVEIRDDVLLELVKSHQTRAEARLLAVKAFEVAEGRADAADLHAIVGRLHEKPNEVNDSRNFITDDLSILENHTIRGAGLHWRLDCLNRSLGPLRVGDMGFVFARPERGKTTFLADQCTFMAGQATAPIVWFNNEEQGEKVRLRTIQAALGITQDQIWKDKNWTQSEYRKVTKGNLHIYDDASIHRADAEAVIERLKPQLVVFDQIDKIKGFSADRPDLVLGRIYQWARELAKNRCAVIGICQSDGTGEGVKWLTMAHVAEAKTSKQAEADWILGIGASNESGTDSVRYLNISKNKLLGDEHTDPNERHGRFEVFIKPTVARYEDFN